MNDLYSVLGVPRTADAVALKNAYRKIALDLHPDRTGNDPAKTEKFRKATEAYAVLSNAGRRTAYDQELASGGRAGLASSIFGSMFDDLVGKIKEDGIHSGNVDELITDFFGVAKDVKERVPQKMSQAATNPGNMMDFIEQMLDAKIKVGGPKK